MLSTADKLRRDQFIAAHHLQGERVVEELDKLIEAVHAEDASARLYLRAVDNDVVTTNIQLRHELDELERKYNELLRKV